MNKYYQRIITILFFAVFNFTAFAQTPADVLDAKIEATAKIIEQIKPSELIKMIKEKQDFVLIDVREENEVLAGKIESSNYMHSPRGLIDIIAAKGSLKTEQTIVVYCKKGSRGLLAAASLHELGFKKIYNLKGGIHAWMEDGYPITNSLGTFKTVPYELTGCGN
ncbi:Rhodanese domain protein [Denitrovibrio acetiphilus DSM 12809]|uniref:Rhodanese domain protein n=1 Tax=Denitrovibrio acetiphilus (strain DSM 12809 / NBRC 114555 / N2460) TaxID=522772 RepID=D4H0U8_DENA2|nr:rhodanese-like domain-containing protein [Denitrovibrio acetiphilus]ADD68611.1 Rhodanese domain protein [Denitrovibrio acetiphilus DSM 12809]